MSSKLTLRDLNILDANELGVVGNRPYENGKWGTQGNKDFVYFEVYDTNQNLIQYENLPLSNFNLENLSDDKISFYPGSHLRSLGFESGTFTVRYNFLRKLAGDESAVLLHTLDKSSTKIGDIYTNLERLHITEDGLIFNLPEQEYNFDPNLAEQLNIQDLKYQIDEISPSRTEVRLKAKKINSSYIDDFVNIQTRSKFDNFDVQINFVGSNKYESKTLNILPNQGDLKFTPQMLNGTLTIDDVFDVDEIEEAVRSEFNVVENPNFELLSTDNLGNVKLYGDRRGWDSSLHSDAVRPIGWFSNAGFRDNFSAGGIFDDTDHIGYHAKVVQKEGVRGSNCLKFTDNNAIFESLDEWPTGQFYRLQIYGQYSLPKLSGQGVSAGDFMNIRMDIKSNVAQKGVSTAVSYAYQLETEDKPLNPPDGYFDPQNPGPTETEPVEPPSGYTVNTAAAATAIEPKPGITENQILTQNPDLVSVGFKAIKRPGELRDPIVGDTTANTTLNGEGAWKILNIFNDGELVYTWAPNLTDNLKIGELSPEGEWEWNGTMWNPIVEFSNLPSPPIGTVNNTNAVNHHPYVAKSSPEVYKGYSKYPRQTNRGENRGWQTGTFLWSDDTALQNDDEDATFLLLKDDLIWVTKYGFTTDSQKLKLHKFETVFPDVRTTIVDSDTQKTLFDDMFEKGFIQSIARSNSKDIVIFYNNGDVDESNNPTEDSNRWVVFDQVSGNFQIKTVVDDQSPVNLLSTINNFFNEEVLKDVRKLEVAYHDSSNGNSLGDFGKKGYKFFIGERVYIVNEQKPQNLLGKNFSDDTRYGANGSRWQGISNTLFPDVMIGKGGKHNGGSGQNDDSSYISISRGLSSRVYYASRSTVRFEDDIQTKLYNCGILGTAGADLTYGVRNPSATNAGIQDSDGNAITSDDVTFSGELLGWSYDFNFNPMPIYDNGTAVYDFDIDPLKIGELSEQKLWKWTGYDWIDNGLVPPRYKKREAARITVAPERAGVWETIEVSFEIPFDWKLDQSWNFYLYGNNRRAEGTEPSQGIVWVDNVFIDFTYTEQSVTRKVKRPYKAQINSISSDGLTINVDKSYKDSAIEQGQDDVDNTTPDIYDVPELPDSFSNFRVTYLNLNPNDLRTYLKFDNQLLLTTNFKQDLTSVSDYPHAVVYKMYEPIPDEFEKFDECIIVKEMANPLEESINIIDFIPEEEPKLVLKSPDLQNLESPVQRRTTQYKTMSDILSNDSSVSNELRNQFLSQSLDSVEINTDYSRFENFVNFSSIETRIRNFKSKLENIESYKISSASYVGVSGSVSDSNIYHYQIEETKNNLDDFERYMYFESSSYISGSLGIFHDNSWPKTTGDGTLTNPYVLAHTTSSQVDTWFSNIINSASLYDNDNNNKLSSLLPEFIKFDESNKEYLTFTNMIGQHFDHIWEYINALSDTYDRRDRLDKGLSKDLLYSVAKSMGWNLADGKDLVSLPKFSLGKEVTGSSHSNYSDISEKDISREIWGRIVNNMPFFLKNKGTVRALKGLINIYGIPSTILRVKEYGGPNVPANQTPQFEITRKFTKALDFRGAQSVKTIWANDGSTGRKPDTIEFRFRAATGSNQILIEKQDANNQDFFIRLKDNGSSDNYGFVSFMMSGSKVGVDVGEYKEITSSALPVFDGDFYSVMVARTSGSNNVNVSQSYELNVGKYDASRSKIHLYSTSTMDVTQSPSASFSNAWTGSGDIFIGGQAAVAGVGARFSGSIMEYRHWTETLQTSSFKNHIANPKAYNGNNISSSYESLVLRYSFDDNKNLQTDTAGIRDVSANQQSTYSGSHSGFTGNFFRSVVDEQKSHIPSIGALRRTTNKIRIENNPIKSGQFLSSTRRVTDSAYDTAPNDSNKVGIWFAPTDVVNNDIINSVGDLNFDNFLGDPRDKVKLSYNGLKDVSNNYWKKYTAPNNLWDYIRLIKYYDQSLYPQLRKLIPARAKPDIGLLVEPNIFERPKVVIGKTPDVENKYFSSSIDLTKEVVTITGSYNHGSNVTRFDAYDGKIEVYSYNSGSVVSSSGDVPLKEASGSEVRDSFTDMSIWQKLGQGIYSDVTMSFGDTLEGSKGGAQDFISGSRIYGINKRTIPYFSSSLSASKSLNYSSSFVNSDLDNYSNLFQGLRNSFYEGVKNTNKTTSDGRPVVEVIISAPTKLVTTEEGDSTLTTGDGIVPDFKEGDKSENPLLETFEQKAIKNKKKKRGMKHLKDKPETDQDRKKKRSLEKIAKLFKEGKIIAEMDNTGNTAVIKKVDDLEDRAVDLSSQNDGVDDGVLNNEK